MSPLLPLRYFVIFTTLPLGYFVISTTLPQNTFVVFTTLSQGCFIILTTLLLGCICHLNYPILGICLSSLLPYPWDALVIFISETFVIFASPPLGYFVVFTTLTPGEYLSSLQEQYLPFILHAKLKSACGGELDASLVSFIDTALQNEERKALLEVWLHCKGVGLICVLQNNYSDELALFYILRDDNDRADYYIDNSYQLFIRVFPYVI